MPIEAPLTPVAACRSGAEHQAPQPNELDVYVELLDSVLDLNQVGVPPALGRAPNLACSGSFTCVLNRRRNQLLVVAAISYARAPLGACGLAAFRRRMLGVSGLAPRKALLGPHAQCGRDREDDHQNQAREQTRKSEHTGAQLV
jgi:hypothetical protein